MCATCGCGTTTVSINGHALNKRSRRRSAEDKAATPQAPGCAGGRLYHPIQSPSQPASAQAEELSSVRLVRIERDILSKNARLAASNRAMLAERRVLALNLVSSPGSGKTTLLVRTIEALKKSVTITVVEGDQQTANDAERIRATGVPAIQINTGKGCHLDAHMVAAALRQLDPPEASLLFIENVGNLVCPAAFDLGEACKVVILSVTEGEDKPLKYPDMFRAARLLLLNKCDLLPYLEFDLERAMEYARRVNPGIEIIQLSATSGSGFGAWLDWLKEAQAGLRRKPEMVAASASGESLVLP